MIDRRIIQKAEEGDREAVLALANAYYDGEDGYKSISKAYELYRRVLVDDPDNTFVINRIGNCFCNGYGVAKDETKAMEYYKTAAEKGYAGSQYNYAEGLRDAGNPDCIDWYEKAYENGDKDALHEIVRIYREGKIVPVDNARVAGILEKGAEKGDPDAVCELACACLRGDFVAKDVVRGITLMRNAAEAGNGSAAENMSLLYKKGEYMEADIDACVEWAIKAARLGCTDQLMEYAAAYFNGEDGFPQDREKAFSLFMTAAEAGDVYAMKSVGVCYDDGHGTEVNKLDAIEWYEKAARKGLEEGFLCAENLYTQVYGRDGDRRYIDLLKETAHEGYFKAMLLLHQCYLNGNHVEKDLATAMRYLDDAVECEYPRACFMKGCYLMNEDIGIPRDEKEALRLWTIAANKGNSDAAFNLGVVYRGGKGASKDVALALQWFEKAAEQGNADAMVMLGSAYDEDGFTLPDYKKAVKWYSDAYEAGSVTGAFRLGVMYEEGRGVAKNVEKAFEIYKFTAEHEYVYGLRKLGSFYLSGDDGIEKDVEKAVKYIEKAANLGDTEVEPVLTNLYINCGTLGLNSKKAFEYLLKKAREGNADAQFWIYKAYTDGLGVEKDEIQAREWCRKAADNGHTEAQYSMGSMMQKDGNMSLAVDYFEKASAGGEPFAMARLAGLYLVGDAGVPINKGRAIELLQQSAEKGVAMAQTILGACYDKGNGVSEDKNKAFLLYQEAAKQGYKDAQYFLGIAYILGEGTDADDEQALYWFRKAAEQGDSKAQKHIEEILALKEARQDGTINYTASGMKPEKAFAFLLQKAREGDAEAQFRIFRAYLSGEGVEQDEIQAREWCRRAADNGHTEAQSYMGEWLNAEGNRELAIPYWEKASAGGDIVSMCQLGKVYLNGDAGVRVNKSRAVELLRQSASKGYTRAQVCLGACYEDGNGVVKDVNKAFSLYQEAAQQEDADAMAMLAKCYQLGIGTAVNNEQTVYWLRKAVAQGNSQAQGILDHVLELQNEQQESGGKPAASKFYCRHCGEVVSDDAKFCSKCGKVLKSPNSLPFVLILALPIIAIVKQIYEMYEMIVNYSTFEDLGYSMVLFIPMIRNIIGVAIILHMVSKKKIDRRVFTYGDGIIWIIWGVVGKFAQTFCINCISSYSGYIVVAGYRIVESFTGAFWGIWFYMTLINFLRIRCSGATLTPKSKLSLGMVLAVFSVLLYLGTENYYAIGFEIPGELTGILCLAFCIRCIVFLWLASLMGQRRIKFGTALICVLSIHVVSVVICLLLTAVMQLGWMAALSETIGYLAGTVILSCAKKKS